MTKFIILSSQRSGSTYFRLLLNSFLSIRCHGEVFLPKYGAPDGYSYFLRKLFGNWLAVFGKKNRLYGFLLSLSMTKKRIEDYHKQMYFDKNFSNAFNEIKTWNSYHYNKDFEKQEAIGYKLMYNQLNNALIGYINENNIRIIHLTRCSKLAQFLSKLRMKKSGVAHIDSSVNSDTKKYKFIVNTKKFKAFVRKSKIEESKMNQLFLNNKIYHLNYEDINNKLEDVLKFLEIKNCNNKSSEVNIKKLNTSKIENQILNFQELKTFCLQNELSLK